MRTITGRELLTNPISHFGHIGPCPETNRCSGFGFGIGRVAPGNVAVAGDAGSAAEIAARRSGYCCGRTGGANGGFTAAVAAEEGIWGSAAGQGAGRTRRGVRNGGALMMNRFAGVVCSTRFFNHRPIRA